MKRFKGNLSYGNIGVESRGGFKNDWRRDWKSGQTEETTWGSRDMSGSYIKAGAESEAAAQMMKEKGWDAARANTYSSLMKDFGGVEGFTAAAKAHGRSVEDLAAGIASKDANAQATAIGLMAEANGGDFQKAAKDLGILMGGKEAGAYEQLEKNAIAAGFGGGAHGIENWARFETSGHTLTKDMAEMANKNMGFAPGEGPFKEGMKAESFRNDDGRFMVDKASYMDGKGSVEVGGGKIKETSTMDREGLNKHADWLDKHGEHVAAFAEREIAGRLGSGEKAQVTDVRSLDGKHVTTDIV